MIFFCLFFFQCLFFASSHQCYLSIFHWPRAASARRAERDWQARARRASQSDRLCQNSTSSRSIQGSLLRQARAARHARCSASNSLPQAPKTAPPKPSAAPVADPVTLLYNRCERLSRLPLGHNSNSSSNSSSSRCNSNLNMFLRNRLALHTCLRCLVLHLLDRLCNSISKREHLYSSTQCAACVVSRSHCGVVGGRGCRARNLCSAAVSSLSSTATLDAARRHCRIRVRQVRLFEQCSVNDDRREESNEQQQRRSSDTNEATGNDNVDENDNDNDDKADEDDDEEQRRATTRAFKKTE
jgi:hypothetical protein